MTVSAAHRIRSRKPKPQQRLVIKDFDGQPWSAAELLQRMDPSYEEIARYPANLATELALRLVRGAYYGALVGDPIGQMSEDQLRTLIGIEQDHAEAIGRLAPACRDVLIRAISEGWSEDEFAEALTGLAYDWWPRLTDLREFAAEKSAELAQFTEAS